MQEHVSPAPDEEEKEWNDALLDLVNKGLVKIVEVEGRQMFVLNMDRNL